MQIRLIVFCAALCLPGATLGCGPTAAVPPLPGKSNAPREAATPKPTVTAEAPKHWEEWSKLEGLRIAVPRKTSEHFAGDFEAETLVGGTAPYPLVGPNTAPERGFLVVQRLFRPGEAHPVAYLAMKRLSEEVDAAPGPWEFVVTDDSGLIRERGTLSNCARCHAEAPQHGLFGQPR
ncbi:MAG: hypothetical protein IPK82_18440 [Polyangiaceae bacterium]|nr:hypothetical protein [Polyangiaceae bacterium]